MKRAQPAASATPLPGRLPLFLLLSLLAVLSPVPAVADAEDATAPRAVDEVAAARALSGVAVEGTDRVVVRLPRFDAGSDANGQAAAGLRSYVNTGYSLRLGAGSTAGEGTAVVEVELGPLESAAPFQLPALDEGAELSEIEALAREITGKSATLYGAVSSVLGWVVHNVVTDETAALVPRSRPEPPGDGEGEDEAPDATGEETRSAGPGDPRAEGKQATQRKAEKKPSGEAPSEELRSEGWDPEAASSQEPPSQEPLAVLGRGSGDAGGIARLTVALLQAVEIEARTVRGRVVGTQEVGEPWGPHTWIEVRYPEAGWVFSDPLHHHHYVPATYLRLATPRVEAPVSDGPFELIERRDRRQIVDLYPLGGPGVTARRNRAVQRAAALRVVVAGPRRGSAVLEGEDGRTSKILIDGESVFVGLATGSYRLEVYLEDEAPIVRQLELGPRERRAIFLRREAEAAEPKPGGNGGRDLPPPDHYRARQPTASQNTP